MDEAESKIASLEKRIAILESSSTPTEDSFDRYCDIQTQTLKHFQEDILTKLIAIRQQAVIESQQREITASTKTESEDILRENASLKKEIERLNYRVNHLVKALTAEELRNSLH